LQPARSRETPTDLGKEIPVSRVTSHRAAVTTFPAFRLHFEEAFDSPVEVTARYRVVDARKVTAELLAEPASQPS
jgi:hypothetical protein